VQIGDNRAAEWVRRSNPVALGLLFSGLAGQELMRMFSMRISSLLACSVHASVPDAYAQHGLKALFKFGIFTLMLSIRVRN
jgi:hypothetical protein